MHHFFLPLCIGLLLAQPLAQADEKKWLVDTNLVYQQGSALSREYLATKAPDFSAKVVHQIQPWIVRIQVKHSFTKTGHSTNHGTGTLLEGGKVITAKHVLTENVDDLSKIKIILTTIDGQVLNASLIRKGETDWAVLQVESTEATAPLLKSPIQLTTPIAGETAVFLGYPAQLGLNKQGKVTSFNPGDKAHNIPVSQLLPMPVVGSINDTATVELTPLAGFPAVGGMSGGPIFNLEGEVIAVQKSIATTTSDKTGEVLDYTLKGEASDLLDLSAE